MNSFVQHIRRKLSLIFESFEINILLKLELDYERNCLNLIPLVSGEGKKNHWRFGGLNVFRGAIFK